MNPAPEYEIGQHVWYYDWNEMEIRSGLILDYEIDETDELSGYDYRIHPDDSAPRCIKYVNEACIRDSEYQIRDLFCDRLEIDLDHLRNKMRPIKRELRAQRKWLTQHNPD